MASNFFGKLFRITTFGESHGKGIGVVIDGCPAGLEICQQELNDEMLLRSGGRAFTTPRVEPDIPEILSGVFEGKTTGHPIALFIRNKNADSSAYDSLKRIVRPSHADFTYLKKYGVFDHRGGGRASARETAARVAAGYFAKKLLNGVSIYSYVDQIGNIRTKACDDAIKNRTRGTIFCPDIESEKKMMDLLATIQEEGDSIGGVLACVIDGVNAGLGEPMYRKLESLLASAMMSLPASKGIEFGCGFNVCSMKGSEHNDQMQSDKGFLSNHAGGVLGGISTSERIFFRVAFKPASSIKKEQQTVDRKGEGVVYTLQKKARHDPCVCIRAVPIVESMVALVLADLTLQSRCTKNTFCL